MTSNDTSSNEESNDPGDTRRIPEPADEGTTVVDTRGQDVGMGTAVEDDTLSVDPSLADSVKSKLDWGSEDDDLPVSPDFVRSIEERVILDVERDEEFQEEAR